ncbi:hypothetical protein EBS57_06645, partial [bacterium]|nr:hypothetical protein [bacterium]
NVLTSQPTISTTAATNSAAGTYPITVGGGSAANYSFAYTNGTLTVTATTQAITFNAIPIKYLDEGSFTLSATASSGLAVSYESSNTNVATVSGSTVTLKSAGSTTITASQAGDSNWNPATNVPQTLTVQARDTDGDGVTDVMEVADGTQTNNAASFNPLSKGLIAFYPFNGNANDSSGNGYHGEVGATTSISNDRFGVASKAYQFDGSAPSGIEAQNTEGLNFSGGKFTVSAWIQSSVLQVDNSIAGKHVFNSQNGYGISMWQDSPCFYVGSDPRLQAPQTYSDGIWHHVVGTWDGARMALYINGVLDVSKNWSYSNFNSARFMIGKSAGVNPHGGGRFIGKIDDVRLYNRALSSSEVVQLLGQEAGSLLPAITSTNSFLGKVGVSTNWTVTASGSTPITFGGTNLPAGLSIATNGTISGTPTTAGTTSTILMASNNYGVATQTNSFIIAKGDQTISFSSLGTKYLDQGSFTLNATASSGLAVSYTSSNTNVATVSGSTVTLKSVGTTTITASQSGDSNWNAATNVPQTLTVQARDTDGDGVTDVMEVADGTQTNNASSFNPLSRGLIAYYPLDGDGRDASGHGIHGTMDANILTDANPVKGGALRFTWADNLTGPCIYGTGLNLGYRSFTVGIWVKRFFGNGEGGWILRTGGWMVGEPNPGGVTGQSFHIVTDSGMIRFSFFYDDFDIFQPILVGEWQHLAFVYDKDTSKRRIYVNGELKAENNPAYGFTGNGNFSFGHQSVSLDEIRFYERALDGSEVSQLYLAFAGEFLPGISSTNSFLGKVGVSTNWTVTASGSTPITFRGTNLPAGLSIATNGLISGTPMTAGTNSTILSASNNYGVATQTNTFVIAKGDQTISFSSLGTKYLDEGSFTLNATASSGLTVSYTSSNTNVATVSAVTLRSAGITTITASQAGNSNWNVAANVPQTLNVQARDTDGDGVTDVMELADGTLINDATSFNPLSKGLIAFYPFNGNANDFSGNGYHGTVYGATQVQGIGAQQDSSYRFVNASDWIKSPVGASRFTSDYTLSIWSKIDDFNAGTGGQMHLLSGNLGMLNLTICGFPNDGTDKAKRVSFYMFRDNPWTQVPPGNLWSAQQLESGPWYHLVVRRMGSTYSIFIDGVLSVALTDDRTFAMEDSFIEIGNAFRTPPITSYYHGSLDNLRMYDRALSLAEISQVYVAESGNLDTDGDGLTDAWERGYGRYQIIPGNFTWEQAKADAEARGGHLATITSEAEWNFVRTVLSDDFSAAYESGADIWLGGSDLKVEGQWEWVTSEIWGFHDWRTGQPNNISDSGDADFLELETHANILDGSALGKLLCFGIWLPDRSDEGGHGRGWVQ